MGTVTCRPVLQMRCTEGRTFVDHTATEWQSLDLELRLSLEPQCQEPPCTAERPGWQRSLVILVREATVVCTCVSLEPLKTPT